MALSLAIEGIIGAGKSSLAQLLCKNDVTAVVMPEPRNEPLLTMFYDKPDKYAFAMQMSMLHARQLAWHKTVKRVASVDSDELVQSTRVLDRSLIGDYAFALWNCMVGRLSEHELAAYHTALGACYSEPRTMLNLYPSGHVNALLFLELDLAKQRIISRGHAYEQGIDEWYLDGLDLVHFNLFLQMFAADPNGASLIIPSVALDGAQKTVDALISVYSVPHSRLCIVTERPTDRPVRILRTADCVRDYLRDVDCQDDVYISTETRINLADMGVVPGVFERITSPFVAVGPLTRLAVWTALYRGVTVYIQE